MTYVLKKCDAKRFEEKISSTIRIANHSLVRYQEHTLDRLGEPLYTVKI